MIVSFVREGEGDTVYVCSVIEAGDNEQCALGSEIPAIFRGNCVFVIRGLE